MGVHLAGSPPHQQCAEWAWETEWGSTQQRPISLSAQRHSAKAVCESLCRLLLRGFHHFPSAPEPWGGGSSFQPQHKSCSLSPYTSHESAWVTQQLAVAQAILCSSHRDLGGSRLFACKHCFYIRARARGSHAAVPVVQCACNTIQGRTSS